MMKFRNLYMVNITLGCITIFGSLGPSYLATKWFIGPFLKGPGIQRLLMPSVVVLSYFVM